jgi:hypothetical protein
MSPKLSITGFCAAIMAIACALPAHAGKKERQFDGQWPYAPYAADRQYVAPRAAGSGGVPSFDGRVTGQPRTCGFDTFRYDSGRGGTVGPYCH